MKTQNILKELELDNSFSFNKENLEEFENIELEHIVTKEKEDGKYAFYKDRDENLYLLYVDLEDKIIEIFDNGSEKDEFYQELYDNELVTIEAIKKFDDTVILLEDDIIIKEIGNFEVENYDLIWKSEYNEAFGGGHDRIFARSDKTFNYLAYSNKNGYDGIFESFEEAKDYLENL